MTQVEHSERAYAMKRRAYDTAGAAEYLGVSPSFLAKKRCSGGGPKFRKYGHRVVYTDEDLDEYADSHIRTSTSQEALA